MSPDVIRSKLILLREVLADLKPHVTESREEQQKNHYEIERQIQLAVDLCIALSRRLLVLENLEIPETNRDVFVKLSEEKIIPKPFAKQLSNSAGLRNLLVHEYGKIDYDRLFDGLKEGYRSFLDFSRLCEAIIKNK